MKYRAEEGQAIFEFVVFLPFMISLAFILITLGSAINGSINQQKATRRYFYFLTKGNSMLPNIAVLTRLKGKVRSVGLDAVGWKEKTQGRSPLAPCYSLKTVISKDLPGDNCESKATGNESRHIKLYTMYGVCTGRYTIRRDKFFLNFKSPTKIGTCALL
ncbi:MAG: hypothetical protein ISR65_05900 [Bacteriovoracaceae bacterium]|nr:hypothetical protein [Bacteriovoracaceae bacterium]